MYAIEWIRSECDSATVAVYRISIIIIIYWYLILLQNTEYSRIQNNRYSCRITDNYTRYIHTLHPTYPIPHTYYSNITDHPQRSDLSPETETSPSLVHVSTLDARPYSRYLFNPWRLFDSFHSWLSHSFSYTQADTSVSGNVFVGHSRNPGFYINWANSLFRTDYHTLYTTSLLPCYTAILYTITCLLHDPPSSSPRTSRAPSWHPLNNNNSLKSLLRPPIQTKANTPGLCLASTILRHRLRRL